jgi:VCBS repeat-containing protein
MNSVATANALVSAGASSFATTNVLNSLVVFDSRLSDLDVLYGALLPSSIGHTIDATDDALVEITRLLAETGAKHLAIVAHGEPGIIHLGRESINLGVLDTRSGLLQEWCLDEISLYSCEVGASAKFVQQLAAVTGAAVAASSTKIGANLSDGNWHLDVATSETICPFDAQKIATYAHVLVLIGSNDFYRANTSTYQPIDLVPGGAGVTSILNNSNIVQEITLGSNSFNFYGNSYNRLIISSNGRIYFGAADPQANLRDNFNDDLSPNSGADQRDIIAVLWDDLRTDRPGEQVLYRIQNNQLTVQWNAEYFFGSASNPIKFQAILQLNTSAAFGNIDFNYVDTDGDSNRQNNGNSATVGIRRATGDSLLISFNSSSYVGNNRAISISSNPVINESVTVSTGTSIAGTLASNSWIASSGSSTYGTYTFTAAGVWTYTLNNSNSTVDALNVGNSLIDTFTVTAAGSTTSTVVSVTIKGQNDPAIIAPGNDTGNVTEGLNAALGTTATANLNATDVDNTTPNPTGDNWRVRTLVATTSDKGKYSIDGTGQWTYVINEINPVVQALNVGQSTTDSFTVTTVDGTPKTITVTINGVDDAGIVTGPITGVVNEANGTIAPGVPSTTGNLNFTDVDNPALNDLWTPVSFAAPSIRGYGNYNITSDGVWTYNLSNLNATVQALQNGQSLTDSFTVGTFNSSSVIGAAQVINITINGINDAASISGTTAATITESTTSTGGNLDSNDVDNLLDVWQAVNTDTASTGGYGTYTITANGVWTYNLNTNNTTVNALNVGGTLIDTFTVKTTDDTPQVVTINITGLNDAPVLSVVQPTVLPIGNINSPYILDSSKLLAGYTDPDGDILSVNNLIANGGSISGNTFTPSANFTGTVNLTYDVVDGKGGVAGGAKSFTIADIKETVGNLQLAIVNGNYVAVNPATNGITNITYNGGNVGPSSYSNWSIIATESNAGRGDIQSLWKHTNGLYWYNTNTDNGGLVTDVASVEANFKQDFNGDRVIGPSIESAGTTTLSLNSSGNYIATNDSVVLDLTYNGNTFNPNTFNGWKVVGAEIADADVQMVWKHTSGQFWYNTNTDNGGFVADITSYEANFQQDFNGDRVIGPSVESAGTTTLSLNSSGYIATNDSVVLGLTYDGNTFTSNTFNGWTVIGAEIAGADVRAIWQHTNGLYWYNTNTDNGGIVADITPYEFVFQQDFNQDGFISQIGTDENDILGGFSTNELLTGGAGIDTFVLKSINNGVDYITDFQSSEFLDVTSFGLSTVNLLTVTGAGNPVSSGANQFIFNSTDGALYFDATAGGNDAVKLATLNGVSSLSAGNFILGTAIPD